MKIIEQFCQGKAVDEALNDDKIVMTEHFIAVLDGATSREGVSLGGMQSGRFAAHALAEAIMALDPGIDGKTAAKILTASLKGKVEAAAKAEGKSFAEIWSWPASALLLYSKARKEIWRVADSTFVLDGQANYKTFPQEITWSQLRRAYLHSLVARGRKMEEFLDKDPSWELLTPFIADFKVFANYDGPYGYGVFNGSPIPDCHVEVYDARAAKEIILASDGYPEVHETLAKTEGALKNVLKSDPLMLDLHPQVKGVKKGNLSFDDRSYIRFSV